MTDTQTSCQDPCAGLNLTTTTTPETNGGVAKGAKTSDYYRTFNIPDRFEHPVIGLTSGNPVFTCNKDTIAPEIQNSSQSEFFQGYPTKEPHPMYRTTNAQYGAKPPTVHTVPTTFHAKSQAFSNHLGVCGMYRNHSLNCSSDKSNVPDH